MKKVILVLTFAISLVSLKAQTFPIDSSQSFIFLKWLLEKKEFAEYKSEIHKMILQYPKNDSLKLDLVKFYESQNQYDSSLFYFNSFFSGKKNMEIALLLRDLDLLIINNNPKEVRDIINTTNLLNKNQKNKFLLSSEILQKQWENALLIYDTISINAPEIKRFAPVMEEIKKPCKSPFLALTMSTIVPGSGKIYSGRLRDGLVSFALVSLFSWQSYVGFHKKGIASVYGWINGGLAGGFYLGGIYGSYKAAHWYNNTRDENIYNQLYFYHKSCLY